MIMNRTITIIDYGTGNLYSICRAVEYLGFIPIITSEYSEIIKSRRLILPGVGAFGYASKNIFKNKINLAVLELVRANIPILGICLGMHLFMDSSEEASTAKGLGIINGRVKLLNNNWPLGNTFKVPNMGWREISSNKKEIKTYTKINIQQYDLEKFYFAHSYYIQSNNKDIICASSNHGNINFDALIVKNSLIGCQFHPEKSGEIGLSFLKEFCA